MVLKSTNQEILRIAQRLLGETRGALADIEAALEGVALARAASILLGTEGLIHVSGAGTSSSLARRCAHLLTCAGMRAVYLDPTLGSHGYSRIIQRGDSVLVFSRGGESDEVNHLLRVARRQGAPAVGISAVEDSPMADLLAVRLNAKIQDQHDAGGPLPFASSLAHASLGDVLCEIILKERGFSPSEFGQLHPGGAVGKRLGALAGSPTSGAALEAQDPPDWREIEGLILDMDGVLWYGERPAPGLVAFFSLLHDHGIAYVLATNNPSRHPRGFAQKAAGFGVQVDERNVITSVDATVHYLRARYPAGSKVFIIGERALREQVTRAGYEIADENVVAVVVALERGLTYEAIKRGCLLIRAGAEFIATNADPSYPTEEGIVPGSGMVVTALAASADAEPVVLGKPNRGIFELAVARLGLPPEKIASVGDRLDTDIAGGVGMGMRSVLLLSGVAKKADLTNYSLKPDWVYADLRDFTEDLSAALKSRAPD